MDSLKSLKSSTISYSPVATSSPVILKAYLEVNGISKLSKINFPVTPCNALLNKVYLSSGEVFSQDEALKCNPSSPG